MPSEKETPMDQSGSKADEQNGDNADGGELTTTSLVKKDVEKVIVHPLVLLSVVDHYNRMRKVGHSRYGDRKDPRGLKSPLKMFFVSGASWAFCSAA